MIHCIIQFCICDMILCQPLCNILYFDKRTLTMISCTFIMIKVVIVYVFVANEEDRASKPIVEHHE